MLGPSVHDVKNATEWRLKYTMEKAAYTAFSYQKCKKMLAQKKKKVGGYIYDKTCLLVLSRTSTWG